MTSHAEPVEPESVGDETPERVALPEPVRLRVVSLAAERLGQLSAEEVPASLRQFARFTPSKRARLAAVPLAAAVETDPAFRAHVAQAVRAALPDLVTALELGTPPAAADPLDVAAAAYVVRTPGWQSLVREAVESIERASERAMAASDAAETRRLTEQLAAAKIAARDERERLRADVAAARAELEDVRRRLRQASDLQRRAEEALAAAEAERDGLRKAAERLGATSEVELRRARTKITELEAQLDQARRAGREARSYDDLRLWVLIETLTNAAQGLRRELALAPTEDRPADAVAERLRAAGSAGPPAHRGLSADDPGWLDTLLGVPGVHVIVDGYNVTKTGFGTLPLEAQRTRLVQGVGSLSARTGAEVTIVFDGAERVAPVALATPRRVRVIFSAPGQLADEVIVELVRSEPAGRPLVVVSSDREVAEGAQLGGARTVPSTALLALLGRS